MAPYISITKNSANRALLSSAIIILAERNGGVARQGHLAATEKTNPIMAVEGMNY